MVAGDRLAAGKPIRYKRPNASVDIRRNRSEGQLPVRQALFTFEHQRFEKERGRNSHRFHRHVVEYPFPFPEAKPHPVDKEYECIDAHRQSW